MGWGPYCGVGRVWTRELEDGQVRFVKAEREVVARVWVVSRARVRVCSSNGRILLEVFAERRWLCRVVLVARRRTKYCSGDVGSSVISRRGQWRCEVESI